MSLRALIEQDLAGTDQLRKAVRRFCAENFSEPTVRALMESEPPFDPKVWARLGTKLGVLGLSVPEADWISKTISHQPAILNFMPSKR